MEEKVNSAEKLTKDITDAAELFELATSENDEGMANELAAQVAELETRLRKAELRRMLSGPVDHANAILSLHPGSGGQDAKGWAFSMIRMYTRWAEAHGYKVELVDIQPSEDHGSECVDDATLRIEGPNAYGFLRAEIGVPASSAP